jgi:hypothetical protein
MISTLLNTISQKSLSARSLVKFLVLTQRSFARRGEALVKLKRRPFKRGYMINAPTNTILGRSRMLIKTALLLLLMMITGGRSYTR